ncbi:hypothetical protein V6N00_13300 [Tersicoccus sp. MR15.9]
MPDAQLVRPVRPEQSAVPHVDEFKPGDENGPDPIIEQPIR